MKWRAASPADLATFGDVPSRSGRAVAMQILMAPAWVLEVDGLAVLLCGAAPAGDMIELWLALNPLIPSLPRRTAIWRELLMRVATYEAGTDLVVRIRDDNKAGQHMAVLAGFKPTTEMVSDHHRTWLRARFASALSVPPLSGKPLAGPSDLNKQHAAPAPSVPAKPE